MTLVIADDFADAFISTIIKQLNKRRPLNSFQRGIRNVTYILIAFMLVVVPIVSTQEDASRALKHLLNILAQILAISGRTTATGETQLCSVSVWPLV